MGPKPERTLDECGWACVLTGPSVVRTALTNPRSAQGWSAVRPGGRFSVAEAACCGIFLIPPPNQHEAQHEASASSLHKRVRRCQKTHPTADQTHRCSRTVFRLRGRGTDFSAGHPALAVADAEQPTFGGCPESPRCLPFEGRRPSGRSQCLPTGRSANDHRLEHQDPLGSLLL